MHTTPWRDTKHHPLPKMPDRTQFAALRKDGFIDVCHASYGGGWTNHHGETVKAMDIVAWVPLVTQQ